jgi:hypothetical protein
MPAAEIAEQIQQRQEWSDTFLLALCLEYIENQQADDAFHAFLEHYAQQEEKDG